MPEMPYEEEKESAIHIVFTGFGSVMYNNFNIENVSPEQILAVSAVLELYAKAEIAERRVQRLEEIHQLDALKKISEPKVEIARS